MGCKCAFRSSIMYPHISNMPKFFNKESGDKRERVNRRKSARYIEPAHLHPLCFIPKDPNVLPIHHIVSPPVVPVSRRPAGRQCRQGVSSSRRISLPPSHLTAVVSAQRTNERTKTQQIHKSSKLVYILFAP